MSSSTPGGPPWRSLVVMVALLLIAGCGSASSAAPSPVIATVGATSITQHLFEIRMASVSTSVAQGGGPTASAGSGAMTATLRAQVLKSLIFDAVITDAAEEAHIAATDQEVASEVAADTASAGGPDALATQLSEAGGSMDQLRDEIRSSSNEQRVEDLLARQRATEAIAALDAGTPFATVAADYSDDDTSNTKGGALGTTTLAQLATGNAVFMTGVLALRAGQTSSSPIHDPSGYEIVRVDAATATTRTLHRILIAAPNPYTVRERPAWFAEAVLNRLATYCNMNQVHVFLAGAEPICVAPSPGAPSATPVTPVTPLSTP